MKNSIDNLSDLFDEINKYFSNIITNIIMFRFKQIFWFVDII